MNGNFFKFYEGIFDFGFKKWQRAVFKNLSVCLFQRCGPRDDIANLVTLKKIFGSLKLYSLYLVE